MKKLFEFCGREENCKDEDFRGIYKKKMLEGKNFSTLSEEELKRLNELCSNCKEPLKIEEKKCPVCENEDLQPPELIIGGKAGSIEVYNHRCERCDRVLYSHGKFT